MKHLHNCQTIRDDNEVVIDICKECKAKLIYRKCRHSERIDNDQYRKDHQRDFLQRGDKLWNKYYGNIQTKSSS